MKTISPNGAMIVEVGPVDLAEIRLVLRPEVHRDAVQTVVHGLGDGEEPLVAADDVPAGVDADLLEQGDHPGQDLGHPAADGRRVDVLDHPALEQAAEVKEHVDVLSADDRRVEVKLRLIVLHHFQELPAQALERHGVGIEAIYGGGRGLAADGSEPGRVAQALVPQAEPRAEHVKGQRIGRASKPRLARSRAGRRLRWGWEGETSGPTGNEIPGPPGRRACGCCRAP